LLESIIAVKGRDATWHLRRDQNIKDEEFRMYTWSRSSIRNILEHKASNSEKLRTIAMTGIN